MATLQIKKAEKKKRKLRLALIGVSKSGKTFTALKFARALAGPDGKIGVIETEGGNSEIYQGDPGVGEFDVILLEEFSPATYIKAMDMFAKAGYSVIVQDSLSHAWAGRGGCLEIVDTSGGSSKFSSGWSKATPLHNDLIAAINSCPVHLIATMRQKADYVLETDAKGRQVPRRVGMAAVQREGMEYEFDITGTMQDAVLTIDGIRGTALESYLGQQFKKPGAEFIDNIRGLLDDTAPAVNPEPKRDTRPPRGYAPPRPSIEPTATPAQSRFAKAQQAISAATTVARIEFLHNYALELEQKGELTADEMLELSQLCESMRMDIELANSNNGTLQPI